MADKGNSVILMDKSDYDGKIQQTIRKDPYVEYKYKNDKSKNHLPAMVTEARECRDGGTKIG